MNSPGSVKSESQKMEERGGAMRTGAPAPAVAAGQHSWRCRRKRWG